MRINTNINAMTALNQATKNTALAGTSMGKLSSGERINKAGDDAAGMAISEKMRSQLRGLDQASRNTQDGISVVQTAEGAMEETGNILQRMRELSVQSSNETNSVEDREKIATELNQLAEEIDRIAESTEFNGKKLLEGTSGATVPGGTLATTGTKGVVGIDTSGLSVGDTVKLESGAAGEITLTITSGGKTTTQTITDVKTSLKEQEIKFEDLGVTITLAGTPGVAEGTNIVTGDVAMAETTLVAGTGGTSNLTIQAGANTGAGQTINIELNQTNTTSLGLSTADIDAIANADLGAGTTASNALIDKIDDALETVNTNRANLGATQNRLETAQSNLTTSSENLTAAESRIRDVDVAKEMMNLSKLNLLNQASQAMMSQAKSQPEGVMQLLR